jgi:hypothetical protein
LATITFVEFLSLTQSAARERSLPSLYRIDIGTAPLLRGSLDPTQSNGFPCTDPGGGSGTAV